MILDNAGNPLVTEFFAPSQQVFQPHFNQANPITRDDQVQIYEELALNPEGQLTTSFLALDEIIKNNRLLPQGWSATGPSAEFTKPEGVNGDPNYADGSGSSIVRYPYPSVRNWPMRPASSPPCTTSRFLLITFGSGGKVLREAIPTD